MLIVRDGAVKFIRDGVEFVALPDDALVIGRGGPGELTFFRDGSGGELMVEILTFDERSIAKALQNHEGWETAALWEEGEMRETFALPNFKCRGTWSEGLDERSPKWLFSAINLFLEQYRPGLGRFLRKCFYQPRWKLCVFLEKFVLLREGAQIAGNAYGGGPRGLHCDCLLYLGIEPKQVMARRRAELAKSWLRCDQTVEDVAKVLGFSNCRDFEFFYSGATHQRCRDAQAMPPLSEAGLKDLIPAMLPFWWPENLGISNDKGLSTKCDPEECIFNEDLIFRPEKAGEVAANSLRDRAADFFAMKATGAQIIVPVFGFGDLIGEAA